MNAKFLSLSIKTIFFFFIILILCIVIWRYGEYFFIDTTRKKEVAIIILALVSFFISTLFFYFNKIKKYKYRNNEKNFNKYPSEENRIKEEGNSNNLLLERMKGVYGLFWQSKVKINLLIGASTSIEKLTPNLTTDIWQENNGTLLIYGGDIHQSI
ncbi:hypothetical protein OSB94_19210, partial [Proteus vulgaris]|nr:hypothetical protein [Proteus vulgaris]